MASNLDNSFSIPDPADILAEDQASTQQGLDSANPNARNASLGALFGRVLNGDPRAQKAQAENTAATAAIQNLGPQQDGETDMDYQIRKMHGIYQAVAPLDANLAMKAADNIVRLNEARQQQSLLQTREKGEQQEQLIKQQTQGTFVVGSGDGTKEFGTVNRFNDDGTPNPKFSDQLQSLQQQNPGSQVATSEKWFANKAAVAAANDASKLQIAQMRAATIANSGLTDDGLRQLTAESVMSPQALARQPAQVRAAIANLKAASGVTPADELAAQLQIKALQARSTAAGRRDGNILLLKNTISGFGQQVLQTLNGVDRTRVQIINSAISAGKTQFSDPGETRYNDAIQSFINEYARVLSGGGNVTTDNARDEARALLNKIQGPGAVKAAVDQLANKELGILNDAGDQSIEMVANTKQYSAINKIQERLGIKMVADSGPGNTSVNTPANSSATFGADKPPQTTVTPLKSRIDSILGSK